MLTALRGTKEVITNAAHLLMIDENESYNPSEAIFDVVRLTLHARIVVCLGPHHNNYDGVATSVTSCLSVRLSVCPSVCLCPSKSVNFFVLTIF